VTGLRASDDRYAVIELRFARGTLRLSCDDDTDEIIATAVEDSGSALVDVAADPPFVDLIGKTIEYAWTMTNHRGYEDAFQLRLLDLAARTEATRQFEVAASAISAVSLT
jgi:hypothetical protein